MAHVTGHPSQLYSDKYTHNIGQTFAAHSDTAALIAATHGNTTRGYYHQIEKPPSWKYPQDVGEDVKASINYNTHDSSEYAKKRLGEINKQSYEPFIFFEFLQVMSSSKWAEYKKLQQTYDGDDFWTTDYARETALDPESYGDYDAVTKTSEFMETEIKPMLAAVERDPNVFDKARRVYNGSVALYMPTDIAINDTVVYNEETRKAAATLRALKNNFNDNWINPTYLTDQSLTALVVAGVVGASKFIGRGKKDIPVKVYKGFMGTLQKFFAGSGATVMAGLGGLAIGSILSPETQRHIGKVLNPHEYMAYQSTGMRNFTFTWKFLPDNPDESVQCREIIKHFRIAAHAERLDTLRLSVPDHVVTSFHGAGDMIQLPPTVIESTTVSYNPNAASFFKHNGAPVEVDLSVTLKEMVPIYKDDVRSGY